MSDTRQFKIQIESTFKSIKADDWDRLILPGGSGAGICNDSLEKVAQKSNLPNPFVTHAFLSSLEESGSATLETGWLAQHLLLVDEEDKIIAALACYLKNHSQGEYVFDHGWADAFERAGGRYYPKLQCSVPFTPVSGPRFLIGEGNSAVQYRSILASGLKQLCSKHQVSSAHITFMPKEEWRAMEEHELLLRVDQQFHWHNRDYDNFSQFLESLSSRKRKNIRKERKISHAIEGISFEWIQGKDINQALWDQFFEFYLDTGSRKWGRPYLTREFYSMIGERMPEQIVLIMARRNGIYVAGAINFIGDDCLYGRHWGCTEYHPALHFEICYYQAIEYAIAHRIKHVEAGAQGEHKLARGYMPVSTHSAHWIENPGLRSAVANYLRSEREHVKMEGEYLSAHGPFRKTGQTPTKNN
jgi:predicted N-acyltransferase